MTPLEQKLERLITVFERLLERDYMAEHEAIKIELIHIRNDAKNDRERAARESERIDELEDQSEKTGEVFKVETHDKIKKYEENERHWVRYFVTGAIAIFFTCISVLIGYLATGHFHVPE